MKTVFTTWRALSTLHQNHLLLFQSCQDSRQPAAMQVRLLLLPLPQLQEWSHTRFLASDYSQDEKSVIALGHCIHGGWMKTFHMCKISFKCQSIAQLLDQICSWKYFYIKDSPRQTSQWCVPCYKMHHLIIRAVKNNGSQQLNCALNLLHRDLHISVNIDRVRRESQREHLHICRFSLVHLIHWWRVQVTLTLVLHELFK